MISDEIDDACYWYEKQRSGLGELFSAEIQTGPGRMAVNPKRIHPMTN
jgi:hypothetical protein